jgi:TatA/E family protein of Tat protein translocase
MFGIGLPELIIIIIVALIVFGPKKLPDLAKSLGKGLAEFKKATDDFKSTIENNVSSVENEFKDVKENFKDVKENFNVDSPFASKIPSPTETQPAPEPTPPDLREASADQAPPPASLLEDIERSKVENITKSESAPSMDTSAQPTHPPEEEGKPVATKEPL